MQNNLLQIHNLVKLTGQSMATLPFLMLVQSLHITKPVGRSQQQRIELNILIQIMVPFKCLQVKGSVANLCCLSQIPVPSRNPDLESRIKQQPKGREKIR
jgi:hypothetical protein